MGGGQYFFGGQCVYDGNAHDKQEKGKDEVSGGAAVPSGMFQRRVDVPPVARVVHQDHGCHGDATEYIEG